MSYTHARVHYTHCLTSGLATKFHLWHYKVLTTRTAYLRAKLVRRLTQRVHRERLSKVLHRWGRACLCLLLYQNQNQNQNQSLFQSQSRRGLRDLKAPTDGGADGGAEGGAEDLTESEEVLVQELAFGMQVMMVTLTAPIVVVVVVVAVAVAVVVIVVVVVVG